MIETENDTVRTRRRLLFTTGLFAVLILAMLLVSLRYASPALHSPAALYALLMTFPASLVSTWFQGMRLAQLSGPPATALPAYLANSLSSCAFVIIPGRVSEVIKPALLRTLTDLPLASGFAALALERLLDIGCLTILTMVASLTVANHYSGDLQHAATALAALLGVGLAAIVILGIWPAAGLRLIDKVPWTFFRTIAKNLLNALQKGGTSRVLIPAGLQSIVIWLGSYLTFYLLIDLIGTIPLSAAQILFVFVAGTLGFIITVSPGGLGTFEGAIALAMGSFGYTVADAVTIALLVRVSNLLPSIIGAIWLMSKHSVGLTEMIGQNRGGHDK